MAKDKPDADVLNELLLASKRYAEAKKRFHAAKLAGALSNEQSEQIDLMATVLNGKKADAKLTPQLRTTEQK